MADGSITVEVSTQAAQAELERLRAENAALKLDLQYARDGLTKGRSRMREDNERLAREAHTWSKAAEAYAAEIEQWRRAAQRCVTAWTVVRGGVWGPNGLMDEHIEALRKALGPNARLTGPKRPLQEHANGTD